eukprot:Skav234670  [mRNA]  locus=scaffold1131:451566:456727:- [translate_table: standard]
MPLFIGFLRPRLHENDAVDALFAAKDVLWLRLGIDLTLLPPSGAPRFRGNDISPEEEDKKAIADGLHAQAKEAAYGQGYALQTLAHTFCAELSPDEGLPFSEQSVELFATAGDVKGHAMAKAVLAYQDYYEPIDPGTQLATQEEAPEAAEADAE